MSKEEYKKGAVSKGKELKLSKSTGQLALITTNMIGNAYKDYVKREFKKYDGIKTIERLVRLGMGLFFT